jgi:ankyrin repeat protein
LSPQDAEGRTPVHVAISNQHSVIIQLLISHPNIHLNERDRQGLTPFACAMTYKNNKAAEAILKRESGAAEQVSDQHPTISTWRCNRCRKLNRSYLHNDSYLKLCSLF